MSLTAFDGSIIKPPFFWSFSKLDSFRTCPKKLYHTQIKKDFPEAINDNLLWGNRVHTAMAKRIAHSTPLPAGMEHWEKWALWAINSGDGSPPTPDTITKVELKMAITEQMQRCEYFDKRVPVWFRTVADVLKIRGNVARLIDWKTGKPKEDSDQLSLGAFVIFIWFPEVQVVQSQFVYLAHDLPPFEEKFTRADMPNIMMRSLPDVLALQRATESGDFPPKPSGLCVRHCAVKSCAYHGRGNR